MLQDIVLEDCLYELPAIDSFALWSMPKVDLPVRSIAPVAWVYPGGLEAPVGTIYCATFADGTTREILIDDDPLRRNFDAAFFLKAGRQGDLLDEVAKLIIREEEEGVPQSLKDAIRDFESQRDARNAKLKLG